MRVAYDARVRGRVRERGAGLGAKAGAVLVAGFRVVRGWARSRVLRWVRVRSHGAFPKAQDTGTFLMTGARAGACVRSL